jgi:hypothetical protein
VDGRSPTRYRRAGLREALRDYREFRAGELGLMDRVRAMDRPLVVTRVGPVRVWVVLDADLARQVLVTPHIARRRPDIARFRRQP